MFTLNWLQASATGLSPRVHHRNGHAVHVAYIEIGNLAKQKYAIWKLLAMQQYDAFRNQLMQDPSIVNVAIGSQNPLQIGHSTPAPKWDGKDPEDVAHHLLVIQTSNIRLHRLLGSRNAHAVHVRVDRVQKQKKYAERFFGRSLEVVVEGGTKEGGLLKGLARNYLDVHFNGDASKAGSLQQVRVTGWKDDSLAGELS